MNLYVEGLLRHRTFLPIVGSLLKLPPILDCARAGCTLYEIRHAMEKTFGSYKEPVFF